MITDADRTAGSDHLTGRLVDLARAAYWARLMKDEQLYLDDALDRHLDIFDQDVRRGQPATADVAVAQLREDAVSEYMSGIADDEPSEASFAVERTNQAVEHLELIATRAGNLRSYAEHARYLIEPPVWSSYDPWDPTKSRSADNPAAAPDYRAHLEPIAAGDMVYMPALGGELELIQVGTLAGYHDQGVTLAARTPDENTIVQLSFDNAERLVAQLQHLIRFHKARATTPAPADTALPGEEGY